MKSLMRLPLGIFAGIIYPLRAIGVLIQHPRLRKYVFIPMLVNVVLGFTLYLGLLYWGLSLVNAIAADIPNWLTETPHWAIHIPDLQFPDWMTHAPGWLPHWNVTLPQWHITLPNWVPRWPDTWALPRPTLPDWLSQIPNWLAIALIWLIRAVLTLLLLIVLGFVLLQFGVLLGAPWYGKLSEELEQLQTGQVTIIEVGVAQDIRRAIAYELKKLALGIGIGLPMLLLNLVVGIGTAIATPISIATAATLVCMDFLDGALERRRLRFRDKLTVIAKTLPASASFGLACLALVSIPLINLVAIPICVAAGTLFFCDWVYPDMSFISSATDAPKLPEGGDRPD
ncbi:EI24 domain-containing protein [Leptolyngbya sp. AN02str]|uniref:EI24 domain-containing protein n=1 Tax=Leptolyngbya sp. AN02str TaxID=3423363 RepID=UPI003D31A84D